MEHLEEKPRRPKTNLAVIATYIFKPSIFCELERIKPDRNEEIQLSDAIKSLVANGKCVAVELEDGEKRVDVGTPESYVACINDSFDNSRSNPDGDARMKGSGATVLRDVKPVPERAAKASPVCEPKPNAGRVGRDCN